MNPTCRRTDGNGPERLPPYLLRLWLVKEDGGRWRASLENVQTGELHGFADLAALLHYLEELAPAIQVEETLAEQQPD